MSNTSLQAFSSPTRQVSENIFSSSSQQRQKSKRSEKRYAQSPPIAMDRMPVENKENIPVVEVAAPPRRRKSSHFRKPSVYIPTNQRAEDVISQVASLTTRKSSISTETGHNRRVSDADSVMLGQDESFVTGNQRFSADSLDKSLTESKESVRASIPVLGVTPRTCYCRFCKTEVCTEMGYNSLAVPTGIVGAIASLFNCWKGPRWLCDMRVHQCPHCKLVLGKSR